jgi:ribosomal protein L24E
MSTTTRQAYRPSYAPAPGSVDLTATSRCTCGQLVTTEDLFSHDCPDDSRALRTAQPAVPTRPSDSLDHPAGTGGGSPRRRSGPVEVANRYPGTCAACGQHVPQGAGIARKAGGGWTTLCARCAHDTNGATVAPAPAASEAGCKPNRYAGPCRFCGSDVPAGSGLLCRLDGRWAVEHKAGACGPAEAHTAATPAPVTDVAAGHYAIASTGSNDLAFYRVDRPTESDYAGRTFVKLVVGGHPDRNVKRDHVAGILARIAADPDAGARYGQELGQCRTCNRHLTDELSRQLGEGPECRKART